MDTAGHQQLNLLRGIMFSPVILHYRMKAAS
jgi:hypothetical protein